MANKTENYSNRDMGLRIFGVRGKLNQTEFGEIAGTSQANMVRIEKGMVPSAKILLRIARYGSTTVDFLLMGEENQNMAGKNGEDSNKVTNALSEGRGLVDNAGIQKSQTEGTMLNHEEGYILSLEKNVGFLEKEIRRLMDLLSQKEPAEKQKKNQAGN